MKAAQQKIQRKVSSLLAAKNPTVAEHVACLTHPDLPSLSAGERLALLKQTLGQAVSLEFATIPIYLCALWSIKNNLHPAAVSIRNVVQEEMLHLALACNMLASIGGRPKIYDTTKTGLRYPTGLPGGVHPELTLKLSGLTDDALDDFLEVELPASDIDIEPYSNKYTPADKDDKHTHDHAHTIGALYDAIAEEFQSLKPEMRPDNQVSGPLSWFIVDKPEKVESAIHWIKTQGEGAIDTSPKNTGLKKLSHFYRFWEIRKRQKIEKDEATGKYVFKSPLEFPEVWPMVVVPKGGYQKKDVSEDVWVLVSKFDETYTKLIKLLETAWGEGGQGALWHAIETMFDLERYAIPLMQIPIPGEIGNYGPSFRLL
ncbi:MAG TPA: ferritin-like protein [Pyrinomonadaceae bacterium]